MALAYSQAGRSDEVQRLLSELETRARSGEFIGDAQWARAYIAIGNYELALERLESAVADRLSADVLTLTAIAANPWNDPELDNAEFRALLDNLWDD